MQQNHQKNILINFFSKANRFPRTFCPILLGNRIQSDSSSRPSISTTGSTETDPRSPASDRNDYSTNPTNLTSSFSVSDPDLVRFRPREEKLFSGWSRVTPRSSLRVWVLTWNLTRRSSFRRIGSSSSIRARMRSLWQLWWIRKTDPELDIEFL